MLEFPLSGANTSDANTIVSWPGCAFAARIASLRVHVPSQVPSPCEMAFSTWLTSYVMPPAPTGNVRVPPIESKPPTITNPTNPRLRVANRGAFAVNRSPASRRAIFRHMA